MGVAAYKARPKRTVARGGVGPQAFSPCSAPLHGAPGRVMPFDGMSFGAEPPGRVGARIGGDAAVRRRRG